MKCSICKINVNPLNPSHFSICARNNSVDLSLDEWRYNNICFETGREYTREFMLEMYQVCGYSLPDFKNKFGLSYRNTQILLDYYGIPQRSIAEANKANNRHVKYKNTCTERYGFENVSQTEDVKEKKRQTFLEHYGCDNVRKSDTFKSWLKEYMMENYGSSYVSCNIHGKKSDWWASAPDEVRQNIFNAMRDGQKRWWASLTEADKCAIIQSRTRVAVAYYNSRLEIRVSESLTRIGVPHKRQFWISRRSYDIKILGLNLLIEVMGDYWHANPNKYQADDVLLFPGRSVLASDLWDKDQSKKTLAESYGYRVIYLWEYDLRKLTDSALDDTINNALRSAGWEPDANS